MLRVGYKWKIHDENKLKKNYCEICKKGFTPSNYKVHLRTHENSRPYLCSFCKWSFRQNSHLKRHEEKVHKNGEIITTVRDQFECKECDKRYTTLHKLTSHDLLVHQKSQFLTCQVCNRRHVDLDGLTRHYKFAHSDAVRLRNGRLYSCTMHDCHSDAVCLKDGRLYRCKNHDRDDATHETLTDHDYDEFYETSCEETTASKEDGIVEKFPSDKVITDEKEQLMYQRKKDIVTDIPCVNCSKRFIDVECLVLHTVRCHVNSGSTCIKCGKAYAKISAARKHLRFLKCPVFRRELESAGVKLSDVIPSLGKSTCSICNVSFGNVQALDIHMRKHSGEKPHICDECGKGFSQKGNLKMHIESIHEGKRKVKDSSMQKREHKCSICEKSFLSAVDLNAHMRVHSGDKPFKCEHCGREFSQKGNLNIHIRRWHSDPNKKHRKDLASFTTKTQPFPSDDNIDISQFKINPNKTQNNPRQSQLPDFMFTKFKTTDLTPSKQTFVLPSLMTSSITNLDFRSTGEKPVLRYFQHFSAVPSTVITPIPNLSTFGDGSSCFNDTAVQNKVIGNEQGDKFVSRESNTIPDKKTIVGEEETFICQEANVICCASSSNETVDFSLINDTTATTLIDDTTETSSLINDSLATSMINDDSPTTVRKVTHPGRVGYSCEETTVITDSSSFEIIDDSLKENTSTLEPVPNIHKSTFIHCDGVRSSTNDSLEPANETVTDDRNIVNKHIVFATNSYIRKEMNVINALQAPFETTYNPFEGNSIHCERFIEESIPLNSQEVNVIAYLNTPFEPTGDRIELSGGKENTYTDEGTSGPCEETNVIIAVTTARCDNTDSLFATTSSIHSHNGNEKDPICKETNVITGMKSNTNISLTNEKENEEHYPSLCMETNVIRVVYPPKETVSSCRVSSPHEESLEKNPLTISETFASKELANEFIVRNLTQDFDINFVKRSGGKESTYSDINVMKNNSFVCKETNVIKGMLSTFESTNSYMEETNTAFDEEIIKADVGPYDSQETNVISGLNSPIIDSVRVSVKPPRLSNVITSGYSTYETTSVLEEKSLMDNEVNEISLRCQETNVITSLALPASASVINEIPSRGNNCKETNVIASLPVETRNSNFKDTVLQDTGYRIQDTRLQEFDVEENRNICLVTNVITGVTVPLQTTSASAKDNTCHQRKVIRDGTVSQRDHSDKELIDVAANPYMCQVTNVITSVSSPLPTNNTSLRGTYLSDNCTTERTFDSMSSNFINSTFGINTSFEPSPSFESIEEELVPYENLPNQPVFLVLEQTKDLESANFNALCQDIFSSIPTTSTKTQVIVNNNLFNENFFISPNLLLEDPDRIQTNNVSDGCSTFSDVEVEFTDLNWFQNYQLPSLTSRVSSLPVTSIATVIKNISGGEVKDVGLSQTQSNLSCSSDRVLMDCDHMQNDTEYK